MSLATPAVSVTVLHCIQVCCKARPPLLAVGKGPSCASRPDQKAVAGLCLETEGYATISGYSWKPSTAGHAYDKS